MRGQWTNYDSFNLVELIDELKTRIEPPFRVDDTLHGVMIAGRDYHGTCQEIRKWLENDDKKVAGNNKSTKSTSIISINLEKIIGNQQYELCGKYYGDKLRDVFSLDNMDQIILTQQHIKVVVMIPNTIYNVSLSFLMGMFRKSIKSLGKDKFKEVYNFICNETVQRTIEDKIEVI